MGLLLLAGFDVSLLQIKILRHRASTHGTFLEIVKGFLLGNLSIEGSELSLEQLQFGHVVF